MAGKGGGAWKVAYADFTTAMMAFFMVLWITSQNKAVKDSIAQYFENPLGTVPEARATSMHGIEGASADAPFKGQQAGPHGTNKDGTGGGEPNVTSDGKGIRSKPPMLRIFDKLDKTRTRGTMALFSENSATLDDDARRQLVFILPQILGKPNKIEIRGHNSREPLPEDSQFLDEWDLCYARCQAVMKFLMENGVEKSRIRLTQDGSSEPYAKRPWNPYLKSLNSRVEVFAIDELDQKCKESLQERVGDFKIAPQEGGDPKAAGGHGAPAAGHGKPAAGHGAPPAGGHGAPAAHDAAPGHAAPPAAHGPEKPAHAPAPAGHGH